MQTMYRVLQLGIGAALDTFRDEAVLLHYWPSQAEKALEWFESHHPQAMHQ